MADFAELVERARGLVVAGERRVLGIVGQPGAGKSNVADRLPDELGFDVVVVPMDGFHLAQVELKRLDRAERMGPPTPLTGRVLSR